MKNEASLSIKHLLTLKMQFENIGQISHNATDHNQGSSWFFFFFVLRKRGRWRDQEMSKHRKWTIFSFLHNWSRARMDSTHGGGICDVSVSRCDLWIRNALQLMKNMISTFKQQLRATAVRGKKELGFPGYTSRSGLPFFNHVLPFPKRREDKW